MKADAKQNQLTPEAQNAAGESLAEILLMQAESKLAEAKALELENQIKKRRESIELPREAITYYDFPATPPAASETPVAATFTPAAAVGTVTVAAQTFDENGPRIEPSDTIRIVVLNTLADRPIADSFRVEPMGTVALGPAYGRVTVAGLTILEAEKAIEKHLSKIIDEPALQVTLESTSSSYGANPFAAPPLTPTTSSATPTSQQGLKGEVDRLRRELEKLQAAHAQSSEPHAQTNSVTLAPAEADSAGTLSINTHYGSLEEYRQAVTRQHDRLRRERDALQKENEELKKQLELRTHPDAKPPTATGTLAPDRLLLRTPPDAEPPTAKRE